MIIAEICCLYSMRTRDYNTDIKCFDRTAKSILGVAKIVSDIQAKGRKKLIVLIRVVVTRKCSTEQ